MAKTATARKQRPRAREAESETVKLAALIDQAGALREQRAAYERSYDRACTEIHALLVKRGCKVGDIVKSEAYQAMLKVPTVREIDVARLKGLVPEGAFLSLVTVPLGAAESALTPEVFSEVCRARTGAPQLRIEKADRG